MIEESGPGVLAGPMNDGRTMTAQVRKTHMIPFLGPFAGTGMIFGTWAVLSFFESCIPQWSAPIIHCEHSIQFYSIFACGVVVLAGLVAWVTSVIYYPMLPFPTTTSELPSALLFNFFIAVVSYAFIRWEMYLPNLAGSFFNWLGAGLLVCGMLLILVNHFSRKKSES